ncbi:substrate-binding domain-containing protein [Hoeflea sp.]|uniref:substrate-binding domain-containing protein n=1 Tax=Hoeflea sp. TaxID=1940281 RepID=UPI0025BC2833|nr:substrate-binding domain-containing protein [Hoeflea sp.]
MATTAVCLGSISSAQADTLRIGGTGSATVLMQRLGAAFEASHADTSVEVIPGLGSSGGIAAVLDNVLDLAVSARPLKPVEQGLTAIVAVRTPYGLVSSNPHPGDVAKTEVAAFYANPAATWPDGTSVRVILRPKSESDTALLGETFPGMAAAIEKIRSRIDVPVAATDQDNLEMASTIKGSLVGTSLTQIVTENYQSQLHFLTIDGAEPTLENLENGVYPYSKPYRFVFAEEPSPLVQRFMDFIASSEGKSILRASGSLSATR